MTLSDPKPKPSVITNLGFLVVIPAGIFWVTALCNGFPLDFKIVGTLVFFGVIGVLIWSTKMDKKRGIATDPRGRWTECVRQMNFFRAQGSYSEVARAAEEAKQLATRQLDVGPDLWRVTLIQIFALQASGDPEEAQKQVEHARSMREAGSKEAIAMLNDVSTMDSRELDSVIALLSLKLMPVVI